jgi:hypothetical protein
VRNSIAAGADPAYAIALGSQFKEAGHGPQSIAGTITDGVAGRDRERIAEGGSVAPTIEIAHRMQAAGIDASGVRQVAIDGAQAFTSKVGDDVATLAKHDAELAWLVKNDGPGMSASQLRTAVDQYRERKGPGWQTAEADLKRRITDDGAKLIGQLSVLGSPGAAPAIWRSRRR